jgi:hypothetical protein
VANDEEQAAGPQAAVCLQWVSDTARTLAAEAAGEPAAVADVFSAVLALGVTGLAVGVALAQQDRASASAAIRQLTALQEQTLIDVDASALAARRQRTAYLDIARRLITQAPLATEGEAPAV